MNSRSRSENAQRAASNFSNLDFDFGLGAGFSRSSASGSLNSQKQQNAAQNTYPSPVGGGSGSGWASGGASWAQKPTPSSSASSSSSSSSSWTWSSSSSSSSSAWSWQSSSGGSALHAPPRSMVGDITGKSWGSMDPNKGSVNKSGLVGGLSRGASPDMFGDLLGTSRSSSVLSNKQQQTSQGYKSSTWVSMKDVKTAKTDVVDEMGVFVSAASVTRATSSSQNSGWAAFEALSSKTKSGLTDQAKMASQTSSGEDPFGDFQGVSSSATPPAVASSKGNNNVDPFAASSHVNTDFFGSLSKPAASSSDGFFNLPSKSAPPSKTPSSSIDLDPFAFLNGSNTVPSQPINTLTVEADLFESVSGKISNMSTQPKLADPVIDTLWSSGKSQPGLSTQNVGVDDWNIETDFGGHDSTTTTELDGLPPPPAGVSAALLKDKGLEFYKQGQFADAIKWLSWAEVVLQKSGKSAQIIEVLTCRSSCLKEAGEYKKAVADCSKVIELDKGNTAILLQRALLYESMEKYKLGIVDLKEVLKREPQNRVANNTLSRLKKMGD